LGEEILSKVVLKEKKRKQDWISDENKPMVLGLLKV
jgi:hypothetical protein